MKIALDFYPFFSVIFFVHYTGRLEVSVQPLRIGRCSKTDAFYGYLDFVSKIMKTNKFRIKYLSI